MKTSLFLFPLLFIQTAFAQVAKDDIAAINKAYIKNKMLAMKTRYEVFKNRDTDVAFQEETGEIKKYGNLMYSRIGDIETIQNTSYYLIADHEDKNISLLGQKIQQNQFPEPGPDFTGKLEKLLSLCSKVEFKKENKTQNSYLLSMPYSEYNEMKIFYNKETFVIEKLILYFREAENLEGEKDGIKEIPRVEITYTDINLSPDFKESDFTYDKFLEKVNGKFYCKNPYKKYTLTDHLLVD